VTSPAISPLTAHRIPLTLFGFLVLATTPAKAQVQIRFGDSTRTNYSELHDALREHTLAGDTVAAILKEAKGKPLWLRIRQAMDGKRPWSDGLLALTRLAELREPASADSARSWRHRIGQGSLKVPPGEDAADLLPALHALELELARGHQGDQAILNGLMPRISTGDYDLGDAWVFGRLGGGAADTVAARFLATEDQALRIRYLTLLSFSCDSTLTPFLAAIYAAPDSFGLPKRIGVRASDGLIWIGTKEAVKALLTARDQARARGTYADPRLGHADLDFLGNDSSMVVSRTGLWLTDWLGLLKD
jgi:hypothetical protein